MIQGWSFLAAVCVFVGVASAAKPGDVLFADSFNGEQTSTEWRSSGTGSTRVTDGLMQIELANRGNHLAKFELPIEQVRGFRVTLSARIKAKNVGKPREPWNGVKLMVHSKSPAGDQYTGLNDVHGSFDWKTLGRTVVIPADATEAQIIIGLQDSSGSVWFDDVRLQITGVPRSRPATRPALLPPEKLDRRSDLPRLRGVMYGPHGKEADLRKLAEWKGNLIRWQFYSYEHSQPDKRLNLATYDEWLDKTMAEVDRFLPLCEQLGLRVVIDLHTPPGGSDAGQSPMFTDKLYQQKFIAVWDKLVAHYKDQPAVWGYDLVNEPVEGTVGDGLMDWRALAEHVARRVRAIDAKKAIFIEPGPFGGWDNLPFFEPIDVPGVIYSVHMYEPIKFTHQGVLDGMPVGPRYPGEIDGVHWDKAALRKWLEPVRQFQLDYNVPIYIGEFSAIRWSPGGSSASYLRDCIDVFDELGWDWSYHAFREWHGWNVEIGPEKGDESPAKEMTDRQRVLINGFSRNAVRR